MPDLDGPVVMRIAPTVAGERVSVRAVADLLTGLQTSIVHIGDALTGSDFRPRGRSPDAVRKRCLLFFREVRQGSFAATLDVDQATAPGEGSAGLGMEAIDCFHSIVKAINEGESVEQKVRELIVDPRHRARILDDIAVIWPKEEVGYSVELGGPGTTPVALGPGRRVILDGLQHQLESEEIGEVRGVLGMLRVAPGEDRAIRLVGPGGPIRCLLSEEFEEKAREFLGKPVVVYGEAEYDRAGNIRSIERVTDIKPFVSLTVNRALSDDEDVPLATPIEAQVDYRDHNWALEVEELGVSVVAAKYEETVALLHEEILFIRKEYGLVDDEELTVGAQALKRAIQGHLQGRRA